MTNNQENTTFGFFISLIIWIFIWILVSVFFFSMLGAIFCEPSHVKPVYVSVGKVESVFNCRSQKQYKTCDVQTDMYLIENVSISSFKDNKLDVGDTFLLPKTEVEQQLKLLK